jgi:hypothetical protein
MRAVLGMLWASISLRLGLGPMTTTTGEGGGALRQGGEGLCRLAAAAGRGGRTAGRSLNGDNNCNENSDDDNNINNESPAMALTFQKLRGVLHRAIADQASSLRDSLGHQRGDRATAPMMTAAAMAEWDTFVIDLRLSATSRRLPLTLSRLLGWIYRLKGYLSFVPVHLGGGDAVTPPPPGPAPASTSSTVAAIAIVLIPAAMTLGRMPTRQPTIFYLRVSFVLSVHLGGGNAATPQPPGPAPASTLLTVAAIAIVIIPAAMTLGRMHASQPTMFYLHVT